MFKKILIANDGSEGAARALSAAIKLAKEQEAELHMISVEELPRFPASVDEIIEEKAEANHIYEAVISLAVAQAQASGVKLTPHIAVGHPVSSIAEFIEREGFGLLVIGYMGHSALYNRIIGSTTDRLVEYAPCAVLVIKWACMRAAIFELYHLIEFLRPDMEAPRDAILLRIFIGEADGKGGRALHRTIVEAAFKAGLAGATALHGPLSYGHGRHLNSEFNVDAPGNLPVVVEIVDAEAKIESFLPELDKLIGSGLVTLEKVRMARAGRLTKGPQKALAQA